MKYILSMMILILLMVLIACKPKSTANDNVENNIDNSVTSHNIIIDEQKDQSNTDISGIDDTGYDDHYYYDDDINFDYIILPNGTIVDTSVPEDIVDMLFKRIEAVENGDISAFRSTLGEMQDGVDYYYQLSLLFKFFGDFINIDLDTFNNAVAEGTEELEEIAIKLFRGNYPARNRNTGLFIKMIETSSHGWLRVIVVNNRNEEFAYDFMYH